MLQFGKLTDMLRNIKALSFDSALFFVIRQDESKDFIIELNTIEQLYDQGIDAKERLLSDIGGNYAYFTELKKRREGKPFLWITLKDTGTFYESFKVDANLNSFTIEADTIKGGQDLQDRWGNEIIGLTDESIEQLIEFLIPKLIEYLRYVILKN